MDISKLPRMSDTASQQQQMGEQPQAPGTPAVEPQRGPVPDYFPQPPVTPMAGAEAWISIAVGVILMLMSPRIFQYLFNRANFTWTFNDAQGNPLPYPQTVFFWGDLALASFALVLVLEGVVLGFLPRRPLVFATLGLTVLATLLNLGYVIYMMNTGYGFQILAGLAVAFGVYIAMHQWKVVQSLSRDTAGSRAQ